MLLKQKLFLKVQFKLYISTIALPIFTDEITVEWTSHVYRNFESDSFIVAALSISAAYSFIYNITVIPYQLNSDSISNLSTVALGQYFISSSGLIYTTVCFPSY